MNTLSSQLGRMVGRTPTSEDEMRLMKATAWHKQGIVVVHPEDTDLSDLEKAFANGIGKRRHGPRT